MLSGKILGRDGHSSRALAYFPELLPEHIDLINRAKDSPKGTKFFIDDSVEGVAKFVIKDKKETV